jgi:hypothetical protein
MSATSRIPTWALLFAVLILATIYSEVVAKPNFDNDGWHTWRVQAIDDSVRCCGTWSRGKLTSSGCDLDTGRHTRGCDDTGTSDELQVYVRTEGGRVTKIRALSPQCPATSEQEIHDLGVVSNADSVAWLSPYLRSGSDLGEYAISTIAAHAGPEAFAELRSLVEDRKLTMDVREKAIFWLVLAATDERFDYVENLIAGN